jgi:glycosyltransferase involved in cell wall biosynthesis
MLSFVVPAFNEERYLGATLAAIHAAAREIGEPYEIVVVDDASTDATAAIAVQDGARVVAVERRQIAAVRNAGARATSGDILFFVDADTVVNVPLVAEALAALRAGAAGGGAPVRFDRNTWWTNIIMAALVPVFRYARWAAGCFVFCKREAFDLAGGFDERFFAGEEIFFSQALKRHGRFVVVRSYVTSSARKLDHYSLRQALWLLVRLVLTGGRDLTRRGKSVAAFWYSDKR